MQIISDVCEVMMFNVGGLFDHHEFLHKLQENKREILP